MPDTITIDSTLVGQSYWIFFYYGKDLEQEKAIVHLNHQNVPELVAKDPYFPNRVVVLGENGTKMIKIDSDKDTEVFFIDEILRFYQNGTENYKIAHNLLERLEKPINSRRNSYYSEKLNST